VSVRVVVLARPVVDLAAGVAALHLDRRVADREPIAQPLLQASDDMLRLPEGAIVDDHMTAERHLVG